MTSFFKRFRQKMLAKNKLRKYLIYASGEIMLLVIGILIALQINNWNERRKLNDERENYYHQLIADLNTDKVYAKNLIIAFEAVLKQYEKYKETFNNRQLNTQKTIENLGSLQYSSQPVIFETNTIKTLINTGDIGILPQNINTSLTTYLGNQNNLIDANTLNSKEMIKMLNNATSNGANPSLLARIQKQPELMEQLKIAENYSRIILQLEAYHLWQEMTSKTSIYNLSSLIEEADSNIAAIKKELE
ncbi:hypothetical protein MTsPCn5_21510 [Croceitalea sp. MTPC5]|nr:hypothetical protein MTsPCn5_21510 [Croceitalea sp. MTPC5]